MRDYWGKKEFKSLARSKNFKIFYSFFTRVNSIFSFWGASVWDFIYNINGLTTHPGPGGKIQIFSNFFKIAF